MSGFRAVGHGVADVFTLGLWEAIGTPTEGVLRGQKIIIKVYYDKDEVIKKIERSPSS
jgi:hypothetical protein